MRIGIVTQPLEMNYGGILQNWALQQVLKTLGHEPITIDAYQRYSTPHYVFNWTRAFMKRMLGKKVSLPKRYKGTLRGQLMGQFIEEHINKTEVMWDYRDDTVERYGLEAIVVGSDQVWRAEYNSGHLEDMYLHFASGEPIKKVAYGASFGVDQWEYTQEQTAKCRSLAQEMDAISVREESGVALCREYLGINAQCVLDPTLLLDAHGYDSIIDQDWATDEPYLAVYCLDITPEKEAFFNRLAAERGLVVRYFSFGWKARLTVEQWLAMLRNATVVVTDSFHGTVFSILFHRDFYTLCNPERGNTRMAGLLEKIGLQNRLLSEHVPDISRVTEVDWTHVESQIDGLRKHSISFLGNSLKN